jgi:uncharacterized repeat protein (TIGR01451 family)
MPANAQNLDRVLITSNAVVVLNKSVSYTGLAVVPGPEQDVTYYSRVQSGLSASAEPCEVFNNNLPLDPAAPHGLTLKKTASQASAELGDLVAFSLKVSNLTQVALPQVSIKDQLPVGFRYVAGSTRVDGGRLADPSGGTGPDLVFALPLSTSVPLAKGQSQTVSYQARIGITTPVDADSINRAWASAGRGPGAIRSNEADARVHVSGGVFANHAYAFGKVFMDCQNDGVQTGAETGIPGVRIFMEDGTGVVTDVEGKWSLYGLRPVTHVLRLDASTLPQGAQLALHEARQSGQADSVFLDLKKGEWHKANFAVQGCDKPDVLNAVQARRAALIAQPDSEDEASRFSKRLTPDGQPAATADIRGLPAAGSL